MTLLASGPLLAALARAFARLEGYPRDRVSRRPVPVVTLLPRDSRRSGFEHQADVRPVVEALARMSALKH